MKISRIAAALLLLGILLCGCAKAPSYSDSEVLYRMTDCEEAVAPYVSLREEAGKQSFHFVLSPASSYASYGEYVIRDGVLTLEDENGKIFCFQTEGNTLIFDAEHSSAIPDYEDLPTPIDGSIFQRVE